LKIAINFGLPQIHGVPAMLDFSGAKLPLTPSSLYDNIWIPATHTTEYRGRCV
jgi:hypothetical protein